MHHVEHQRTAILVFARSANEEIHHKSILQGKALFDALTTDTLAKVKRTNLPYFHFTEHQQNGASFGERFANAIQSIFEAGFEQIITLGNDSPQLKPQHILETAKALANGKNVLGPSLDGGFYLMGLQQEHFKKAIFEKLPWQTSKLLRAAQHYLGNRNGEVIKLEFLTDIDSTVDIKSLVKAAKSLSRKLRILLIHLFESFERNVFSTIYFLQKDYHYLPDSVRGSP